MKDNCIELLTSGSGNKKFILNLPKTSHINS